MVSESAVEDLDCEVLEERAGARVIIRRSIRKEYDSLEDRKKGKLNAIMRLWCERGSQALTPEMFNPNEGRTSQHSIMLQAFKTFKVRLYGFTRQVGGKRTFVIVDTDPAKKQNKADPKILKRAKRRVDDLSN